VRRCVVFLLPGLVLGCGPSSTTAPPADVGKIAPVDGQSAPTRSQREKSVSRDEARPAVLLFLEKTLALSDVKIESVSEPMAPDRMHADQYNLHGGSTAYYVVSTAAGGGGKGLVRRTDLMWLGRKDGRAFVHGYENEKELAARVEKGWLAEHPPPR
jgi:hypothetical protein